MRYRLRKSHRKVTTKLTQGALRTKGAWTNTGIDTSAPEARNTAEAVLKLLARGQMEGVASGGYEEDKMDGAETE